MSENMDTTYDRIESPAGRGVDPRAYLRVVWRWKFLLLAFVVLIPLATYAYEHGRPHVYQTSSLMEITSGPSSGLSTVLDQPVISDGPDTTDLEIDARLVTTTAVAHEAAKLVPPAQRQAVLDANVSTNADQTTGFLTITAQASTPRLAADVANAYARALIVNTTQSLRREVGTAIAQLQAQAAKLPPKSSGASQITQELARFRALQASQSGDAQMIQTASVPVGAISPRVSRSVILAFIVALLLGLGAVAIAESMDRRIRHPDELGDAAGLPLLSAIPKEGFGAPMTHAVVEAFATLRAALTYFNVDKPISSVLITSPGKADGKTTVSVQLAQALARAGQNVVLVDADLRRPAVAKRIGMPLGEGLAAVLIGELALDDALHEEAHMNGRGGSLKVLQAGSPPPNPSELLGSQRMHELLDELGRKFDCVIVDSTPLLTVSDSMPLLPLVSGVILVGHIDKTSRDALSRLRFVVDSAGGHALGVVATGAASGGLYVSRGYGYEAAYMSENGSQAARGPLSAIRRRRSAATDTPVDAHDKVPVSKND
jgi:tyrosine-protein kinase